MDDNIPNIQISFSELLIMNIEHLKLFVRIASTHNMSEAGMELGLSPAVSSAHINKLEETLGVRLLHRTTRKVALTEEGETFLPHAQDIIASIEQAKASVKSSNVNPQGNLRITAPASFGRMHLVPALCEFNKKYPDITIDIRLSDRIVDIVDGGFDVAIRDANLNDSTLIARKISSDKRVVLAAPSYLSRFGTPKTPDDLLDHRCVNLMGLENWSFATPSGNKVIKTHNVFRTDNGEAVRDACIQGLGITISSLWCSYQQIQDGRLVTLLPDYPLVSDTSIWAIYPSTRLLAPKVRAFIDFLAQRFGERPEWENVQAP